MAVVNKTRNMLEGLMKEGSFKWLTRTRSAYDEEIEEMGRSPSAGKNWLPELSPVANVVVRRCSKILGVAMEQLRENFEEEASDILKIPPQSVRNFLEYCCFRALALSTQVTSYLEDKRFRRLTFDMMVAWEFPAASSQPPLSQMDEDVSVALEAFSRIAPAVPIVADVVVCHKLFEELTASSSGRLQFSVYDKYLSALERAVRKLKTQSESSLLSTLRSARAERILEVDGTVTSQPVLEHVGISTWPGRLVLTDHALYFEALRVVSFDKAKVYDLSDDLKQVVRPELTGPWGTRLFDKAFLYKSVSVPEPVIMELPELKGHTRRDYWLAIIQEVLYAHRFIQKFEITGIQREEALLKAIFGILRVQALKELSSTIPLSFNSLLMFNICDELPGGDRILETLAKMSTTRDLDRTNSSRSGGSMYSVSASAMASTLGFMFGSTSSPSSAGLLVGEIAVGEMSPLEKVVTECKSSYKKVVDARATVDGVKVDGLDLNLAVTMELLSPLVQAGNGLQSLAYWEYPWKSAVFCLAFTFVICRGWLGYAFALLLVFFAAFLVITCWFNKGKTVEELKVIAPPAKNAVEQLLAVQTVISQVEELVQDGNVCLLKLRGLLMAIFPQASEKLAGALLMMALLAAFVPGKYVLLLILLETFTRLSPLRRASTEKWTRRFREWWFSIPAAPVAVERCKEDKKRK